MSIPAPNQGLALALSMTHPNPIEICPYSWEWPEWFAAERALLEIVFSSVNVQIEHIGSTAVPGLGAKPIIDILLGAPSLSVIEAKIPALVALDYQYMPEHETVFLTGDSLPSPRPGHGDIICTLSSYTVISGTSTLRFVMHCVLILSSRTTTKS